MSEDPLGQIGPKRLKKMAPISALIAPITTVKSTSFRINSRYDRRQFLPLRDDFSGLKCHRTAGSNNNLDTTLGYLDARPDRYVATC